MNSPLLCLSPYQLNAGAASTDVATSAFQWLMIYGFPPDLAATSTMPAVFATNDAITANDRVFTTVRPENASDPKVPVLAA